MQVEESYMFFTISKIFWLLAAPLNAILILTAIGLALFYFKKPIGKRILIFTAWVFILLGFLPVGHNLIVFLERQYDVPAQIPENIDGIIVLGGSFNSYLSEKTGRIAVNSNINRMVDFMALSKQYPNAKKVFSGGSGNILRPERKEADDAKDFLDMLEFNSNEFIFERESKNTYENAKFSQELLQPKVGEKWIVITSDFHMPRTVSIFNKLGWDIIPYPTGMKTSGQYRLTPLNFNVVGNFFFLSHALKEMIGVGVYFVTGKSALFFPYAPIKSFSSTSIRQAGA